MRCIGEQCVGSQVVAAAPFHEGEQRVQERLGVREAIEHCARKVVRPFLPEEHREFYGHLRITHGEEAAPKDVGVSGRDF